MIRRVEIVRLDPSASDSGMHIVLVTRTGGRAESLGPFASLWEACSVAGDLDDAEPIDAAALRHEVCTCAECSKPPDYLAADILSNRPTRRRGDTEPLTFDAAAAAKSRLDALALAEVTDAQIRELRAEAARALDHKQIVMCDHALAGHEPSRLECARVIARAAAARTSL